MYTAGVGKAYWDLAAVICAAVRNAFDSFSKYCYLGILLLVPFGLTCAILEPRIHIELLQQMFLGGELGDLFLFLKNCFCSPSSILTTAY